MKLDNFKKGRFSAECILVWQYRGSENIGWGYSGPAYDYKQPSFKLGPLFSVSSEAPTTMSPTFSRLICESRA